MKPRRSLLRRVLPWLLLAGAANRLAPDFSEAAIDSVIDAMRSGDIAGAMNRMVTMSNPNLAEPIQQITQSVGNARNP